MSVIEPYFDIKNKASKLLKSQQYMPKTNNEFQWTKDHNTLHKYT